MTVTRRGVQLAGAVLAVGGALLVAAKRWWVFAETVPVHKSDPTFAQLLFADRATVGFIRLGLVLLSLYVIASVPALVVGGRWLKGFGKDGLTADDAVADSTDVIKQLRDQVAQLTTERDSLKSVAEAAVGQL